MKLLRDGPLMLLVGAGCLLFGIGAFIEYVYCEWRHDTEVQQLTEVTKGTMLFATECMATLKPTVGAAIVLARNPPRQFSAAAPRDSVTRDSLRERRWTTP